MRPLCKGLNSADGWLLALGTSSPPANTPHLRVESRTALSLQGDSLSSFPNPLCGVKKRREIDRAASQTFVASSKDNVPARGGELSPILPLRLNLIMLLVITRLLNCADTRIERSR